MMNDDDLINDTDKYLAIFQSKEEDTKTDEQ
jgi:hypothetical protein